MGGSLPPSTAIGTVHIAVAELDRAAQFYREMLGFRTSRQEGPIVSLSAPDGRRDLVVLTAADRGAARRRSAGLYHFAILLPSRADLGRALRHLVNGRAPIEGASDHGVSEAVYLHDPEGNGIEIYADRPRARWLIRAGILRMTTEPLDVEGLLRESDGSWDALPSGTQIGHIHLRVNDLARSEQFYAEGLGFDVMVRGYPGALFVAAGGYHHHIGLNTWAGPVPPPDPAGPGLRSFTVVLPDRSSLDAALARAAGVGVPAADGAGRGEGVLLRDPDGIGVMLTT